MSRFRLLMSVMLATFAIGAVASVSSASATDTCNGGSHFVFCNDNSEPLVGALVLGTSGLALLAGVLGGAEAKFNCEKDDFHAVLGELGHIEGEILFLECKEEKPVNCKLSHHDELDIHALFLGVTVSQTLATYAGTGPGEEFATLHIEGTGCATPGTFPVTGKQHVETPKGASSLPEQVIIAKKAGSLLKLGGQSASFSSETKNAHLASGLAWLVMAGE